jgi:signal peptidase I
MRTRKGILRTEWFQIALLVMSVLAFRSSMADHYYVPSGSMEYALMPGDHVIVDKTAYGVRVPLTKIDIAGAATPDRGDVVVFDSPVDGVRLIKRIVAIGGDRISLRDGRLSVNGRRLGDASVEQFDDDTVVRLNLADGGGPDIEPMDVPPGMVLALGDHRGNSLDGRYFGLIDETEVLGRALGVFYRRGEGFVWRRL